MAEASAAGFHSVEAATGLPVGPPIPVSTTKDVADACASAAEAFDAYRVISPDARAAFLRDIGREIVALGDELIETAARESGLPSARLQGERARTVGQLNLFAEVVEAQRWLDVRVDPAQPDRQPAPRPDIRSRRIPLGPVAVFGASNFPLAFSTAGGDTAAALAAGCPVVVKGHPAHPVTSARVAEAIGCAVRTAGLPSGVFGHLVGPGEELGQALVRDPHIAAVGFTGSRRGGLALVEAARSRPVPIPVYAEMSSINPVFLLPHALEARAAEIATGFAASLVLGAGQFCTNPGLVVAIDGAPLAAFIEAASGAVSRAPSQTMLTRGIRSAFDEDTDALAAQTGVARVAVGTQAGTSEVAAALFATSAEAFIANPALSTEMFGPASLIVRCGDEAEMFEVVRHLEGQLTATIVADARDASLAARLAFRLELKAGRLLMNGWPTGVEVGHAMVHGGPFPATSDGRSTSVGSAAIDRFSRRVCYQNFTADVLPEVLADASGAPRLRDGV